MEHGERHWQQIAYSADVKRARGEPTGPLPEAYMPPRRLYDIDRSVPHAGSAADGLDDMTPTQIPLLNQASLYKPSLVQDFLHLLKQDLYTISLTGRVITQVAMSMTDRIRFFHHSHLLDQGQTAKMCEIDLNKSPRNARERKSITSSQTQVVIQSSL